MSTTFDLSNAVKAYRMSLALTIRQYADIVGVRPDTLRIIENNRHYVYSMRLTTLDKLLTSLHLTREQYDPGFGKLDEARSMLVYAKQQGLRDMDITEFLGIGGMSTVRDFLEGRHKDSTYNVARTVFTLATDEFRDYIEECKREGKPKQEQSEKAERDKLLSKARSQGFVTWELKDAKLVDDKLIWLSGVGTYVMVIAMTEFKAFYRQTGDLSVYRDLRKPVIEPPKAKYSKPQQAFNAVDHARRTDAQNMASNMFRTIFGG